MSFDLDIKAQDRSKTNNEWISFGHGWPFSFNHLLFRSVKHNFIFKKEGFSFEEISLISQR